MATHFPRTICVPAKIKSPLDFFTASLSPVNTDSSTLTSPTVDIISASAGILSPISKTRISPGTTSLLCISLNSPSLITLVLY